MGEMAWMDHSGDSRLMWNPENTAEVNAAKHQFDELRGKRYLAYQVSPTSGEKGEQMREFDPQAGKVILTPPMAGG